MPSRYSRLDNLSPAESQMQADSVSVGRSAHDCSHTVSGNTMYGLLAPVLCMDVVPNEDIDLSAVALLEFRNPTARQLLNGSRVFFHAYYNRLTDLWEGARNWIDNGRTGKVVLSRPNLIWHLENVPVAGSGPSAPTVNVDFDSCSPLSLLAFLGMPVTAVAASDAATPLRAFMTVIGSSNLSVAAYHYTEVNNRSDYFPADCAFAYQKNWRDFYANKNLLQNNPYWFPDNEDHFILSYSCDNAVCVKYEDEDLASVASSFSNDVKRPQALNLAGGFSLLSNSLRFIGTPEPNNPSTSPDAENVVFGDEVVKYPWLYAPNLAGIKFRQFRSDRFTSGSPFKDLIRGEIPSAKLNESDYARMTILSSTGDPTVVGRSFALSGRGSDLSNGSSPLSLNYMIYGDAEKYHGFFQTHSGQDGSDIRDYSVSVPPSVLTMSDVYTLETLTAFRRRMGMTNGDYNETIKAQFGVSPRVHDRRGTYIGGFYQDFNFTSVTQTSESTSSSPLGQKAGQGVSTGSGRIGHFHTPDYGWIQVYMSVTYDAQYTQGKPRMFSKRSNMELYFPIFNNLPAQEIRNDELFVTGNAATDALPFAYEDRFAEYKSMPNRVVGFMSMPHNLARYDSSRIMSRRFISSPKLNHQFVMMVPENQDLEVFTVASEPQFDFSIGWSIRRVFPGPYTAIEGSLSSPLLNRS